MKTRFLEFLKLNDRWRARHPLYGSAIEIQPVDGQWRADFNGVPFTLTWQTEEDAAAYADLSVHCRLVELAHGTMKGVEESDRAREILQEHSR